MRSVLFAVLLVCCVVHADEGMIGTCNVYCQEVKAKTSTNYDTFRVACENQYSGIALTNPEGGLICIAEGTRAFPGIVGYGACRTPAAIRRFFAACEAAAGSWVYGRNIGDCYTQKSYAMGNYECKEMPHEN
jgi:hypothetical protein